MKFLVTGGLGNIGVSLVDELNHRGHEALIIDLKTRKNRKRARKLRNKQNSVVFGDINFLEQLPEIISKCDCIMHLAALVPPKAGFDKETCFFVNADGTKRILNDSEIEGRHIPIVFVSDACVMGPSQSNLPPVNTSRTPKPLSIYSKSKLQAENFVKNYSGRYCILRISHVLDTGSDYSDELLQILFESPLDARNELILDVDAGSAIAAAGEMLLKTDSINNKTFFIGGGKTNGCQLKNRQYIRSLFDSMGIGMIDEDCFTTEIDKYESDWYDTYLSNELLNYQNHTFEDYIEIIKTRTANGGPVLKYMAPRLKESMEQQSPYHKKPTGGK